LKTNLSKNKTENHFSHYPRSQVDINSYTRLKIAMSLITAVKQLANFSANFSARLAGKAAGQGCRARLPGKAAGQGCRARLPGKAAGQGCRARLPGKGACNGALC
jgi:hypothetical protein